MNESLQIERLRAALNAAAEEVSPRPDAYERALADWRRREKRRRRVGLIIAAIILIIADIAGLWVLNRQAPEDPVVFDSPPPAVAPALLGTP